MDKRKYLRILFVMLRVTAGLPLPFLGHYDFQVCWNSFVVVATGVVGGGRAVVMFICCLGMLELVLCCRLLLFVVVGTWMAVPCWNGLGRWLSVVTSASMAEFCLWQRMRWHR